MGILTFRFWQLSRPVSAWAFYSFLRAFLNKLKATAMLTSTKEFERPMFLSVFGHDLSQIVCDMRLTLFARIVSLNLLERSDRDLLRSDVRQL